MSTDLSFSDLPVMYQREQIALIVASCVQFLAFLLVFVRLVLAIKKKNAEGEDKVSFFNTATCATIIALLGLLGSACAIVGSADPRGFLDVLDSSLYPLIFLGYASVFWASAMTFLAALIVAWSSEALYDFLGARFVQTKIGIAYRIVFIFALIFTVLCVGGVTARMIALLDENKQSVEARWVFAYSALIIAYCIILLLVGFVNVVGVLCGSAVSDAAIANSGNAIASSESAASDLNAQGGGGGGGATNSMIASAKVARGIRHVTGLVLILLFVGFSAVCVWLQYEQVYDTRDSDAPVVFGDINKYDWKQGVRYVWMPIVMYTLIMLLLLPYYVAVGLTRRIAESMV
jgi:hypothetical protein